MLSANEYYYHHGLSRAGALLWTDLAIKKQAMLPTMTKVHSQRVGASCAHTHLVSTTCDSKLWHSLVATWLSLLTRFAILDQALLYVCGR